MFRAVISFAGDLISETFVFLRDLLRDHFDKLLLTFLFIYMTVVLLHMSHDSMDAADISWAREQSNLVVGALLGLITGAVLRNGGRDNKPPTMEVPPTNTIKGDDK